MTTWRAWVVAGCYKRSLWVPGPVRWLQCLTEEGTVRIYQSYALWSRTRFGLWRFFPLRPLWYRWPVSSVQPDKQRFIRDLPAQGDRFPQERRRAALTVLFSFPQLCVYKITFCPNVCHDGCITIISLIGPRYTFFSGFRVIKWCNVNVYRDIAIWEFGRDDAVHVQHFHIFRKDTAAQGIPNGYRLFGVIVVLTSQIQDYFILLYINWK